MPPCECPTIETLRESVARRTRPMKSLTLRVDRWIGAAARLGRSSAKTQ